MESTPSLETPKFKPRTRLRITEQRLKSWRPILTRKEGMILMAVAAAVCIGLGLVFYFTLNGQSRYVKRYDNICELDTDCTVTFDVKERMSGRIELKYELTKFYQNHRRYIYSRVDEQLNGEYVDYSGMSSCSVYRSTGSEDPQEWILPCGLFALSALNDSFTWNGNHHFTETGIAFESELDGLFKDLNSEYKTGHKWLENNTAFPGGLRNEHFIVWMRASFMPTLSKLYAICDHCTIEPGRYTVNINNVYPTSHFQGEKRIVLEEVSLLGSKNIYLGAIYMICGAICGIYALVILIISILKPREVGEYYR